jgi:hypothetical protein
MYMLLASQDCKLNYKNEPPKFLFLPFLLLNNMIVVEKSHSERFQSNGSKRRRQSPSMERARGRLPGWVGLTSVRRSLL